MNPRTIRRTHLYLGALFAPVLLLFTISGAWQVFRWNDAKKDGSYTPPRVVRVVSSIHRDSTLGGGVPPSTPFKMFAFGACGALAATTILGILMAYRFTPNPRLVTLCLLLGIVVPAALLLLRRARVTEGASETAPLRSRITRRCSARFAAAASRSGSPTGL